jgi:hypothetical protein
VKPSAATTRRAGKRSKSSKSKNIKKKVARRSNRLTLSLSETLNRRLSESSQRAGVELPDYITAMLSTAASNTDLAFYMKALHADLNIRMDKINHDLETIVGFLKMYMFSAGQEELSARMRKMLDDFDIGRKP